MRDDTVLDQGGSGGGEVKLESGCNLIVKPSVFAFRFWVCRY